MTAKFNEQCISETIGRVINAKRFSRYVSSKTTTTAPGTEDEFAVTTQMIDHASESHGVNQAKRLLEYIDGSAVPEDGLCIGLSEAYTDVDTLVKTTSTELVPFDLMDSQLPEGYRDQGMLSQALGEAQARDAVNNDDWIPLEKGAVLAQKTTTSFRVDVFDKDSQLERSVDPDTRRVQISKASLLKYLENRNRTRWQSLTNPDLDSRTATPTNVLEDALNRWDCSFHSKCKPNSKAMACIVTPDEVVIAIEKRGRPKMWVRPLPGLDLPGIPSGRSEASSVSLDPNENYGRHSGLKKYPELRASTLVWFAPVTMEDFNRLMTQIKELSGGDA